MLEAENEQPAGEQPVQTKARAPRIQSTIQFPYSDIGDAVAVAEALLKAGGVPLTRDQVGAAMGLVPSGGGFNTKISTARMFGVIEVNAGKYQLTELGFEIVDPRRRQDAMATAFLNVELYRKVYDEFRGKRLPPRPHGLEAAFVNFGVSPRTAGSARVAFDRSARMAGFFPNGDEDRLVVPFQTATIEDTLPAAEPETREAAPGPKQAASQPPQAASPMPGLHRSILGMLDELPAPKTNWNKQEQADWLQALATMFQVIYKSEDKGDVTVSFMPD